MVSDYDSIKNENIRRYGTDIARIGPMLLADRYDERSHFIYELLQNAEDALRRRPEPSGPRNIDFRLSANELRVSHYGKPFDQADIRGICGIGQSTKPTELTAIGRFGIGFKSVYAFTAAPQIHSGDEHFAIDSFVWPRATPPLSTRPGETLFVFPFRPSDNLAHAEIAEGLKTLGARTLLFLKDIEEISWTVEGGASGLYIRSQPEQVAAGARRVVLLGQDSEAPDTEETWLIFARDVFAPDGSPAGQVEIAFALDAKSPKEFTLRRIQGSTLVVFFPTIVQTNCGFLLQGPYRTTPSRDNVPRQDEWNQHLIRETASLLVAALPQLRTLGLLGVDAIRALPIDRGRFDDSNMFKPLFEAVRTAFAAESLLPAFRSGHTSAGRARLARTKELRELLSPMQLGTLFDSDGDAHWLSEDITPDRTPELRQYLLRELQIAELDPERLLPRFTKAFLESQSDDWMASFYIFLSGQPALWQRGQLNDKPIVRLESGEHVAPWNGKLPQAFLPGVHASGFPTVRHAICERPDARTFLVQLGLTEPDPVDDVVANVLPRYQHDEVDISDEQYAADVRRILAAFGTDSKAQRDKLIAALRDPHRPAGPNGQDGDDSPRTPRHDSPPGRNDPTSGTRKFHTYVAVGSDDHEPDPDGLTRDERLSLEEMAIGAIIAEEPALLRTPTNNVGFDLLGPGEHDRPDRRIEVKAMARDLKSRPVGMSQAQFECAREHGSGFWLYVVEHAADPQQRRIVRIPAVRQRVWRAGPIGVVTVPQLLVTHHLSALSRGNSSPPGG